MDAIVTAGGIPQPEEPLYEYTQGKSKALLDIAGKPMIQWVLDALCASRQVENVIIIGLPSDSGLICPKLAAFLPNQKDMVANIRYGVAKLMEINPHAQHVLVSSSDIPGVKTEMVDWIINTAMQTDEDVYYSVIERGVMEERFPASRRSYIHLKDMEVCGGDMNMISTRLVQRNDVIWDKLVESRKNALKQAALIGYDTLILLLLRVLTLETAIQRVTRRLKVTGRALVSPYAEIGMDIDKPHQLEILRADLALGSKTSAAA
jgi:GTP:adenosylcobinamide-phosphate guanylyltransferase